MDALMRWLIETGLPPHGYCLLWQPQLVALHVVSDAIIGLAYFSIPVALAWLVLKRRQIEFNWVIVLFAAFILACGTTHFISILVLWVPAYGLEGVAKAFTAIVSIATAILIWPIVPKILAMPSPTELQRLNAELVREAEARAHAEEQLRQAQKMEAFGQLTGGIAHDFNNLLLIVAGNIERAMRAVPEKTPAARNLANALTASDRAGALTAQLLAFARKSPLEVRLQEVAPILQGARELLGQAAGENVDITFDIADDLHPVLTDRNQLENALLNLVLNARDAMPAGGKVGIAARNRENEVEIVVRDEGTGMDEATLEKAAEPFFTTKPIGSGSGLGLSQVYGFLHQIGGRLQISSTPGTGTTVRLFLSTEREAHGARLAG